MKILYVTTIGSTMNFFDCLIKELIDKGNTVDIATNELISQVPKCYREWGCTIYQIDTSRSPLNIGNINAIKQLSKIVAKEKYDIVHCHTPVAAMCTRIACRKVRKQGTKVFYTAHGFHFYKGAPLKNWLLYYPVEKICSYFTDVLITINKEDYKLAKKKMKAKCIEYVSGVGIDLQKFENTKVDKALKRKELGIPQNATLLISVGELNKNKNHETVIRAIANLDVYYIIAGKGGLQNHLQDVINELNMTEQVKLLGFRNDIQDLCHISDIFIFPSFREGLSVSVMEAMACGLPVVCSNIRGNTDLIDKKGGVLFNPQNTELCRQAIKYVIGEDYRNFGEYNKLKANKFSVTSINNAMFKLYGGQFEERKEYVKI